MTSPSTQQKNTDWEAHDDWAPMPYMKEATPSQMSEEEEDGSSSSSSSEVDEEVTYKTNIEGIVVDTRASKGQVYVCPAESLTLSLATADEDGTSIMTNERYAIRPAAGRQITPPAPLLGKVDEEEVSGEAHEQEPGTAGIVNDEEQYEEVDREGNTLPLGLSTMPPSQEEDDQFKKLSEFANVAGASAVEAGLQFSSFLRQGLQMGLSGVAKQLESMEDALQKTLEEAVVTKKTTAARPSKVVPVAVGGRDYHPEADQGMFCSAGVRHTGGGERREEEEDHRSGGNGSMVKQMLEASLANPPLLSSHKRSFEDSTISSMGDTFHEYVKPRIEMSKKEARAASGHSRGREKGKAMTREQPPTESDEPPPRFRNFEDKKKKASATTKTTKFAANTVTNKTAPVVVRKKNGPTLFQRMQSGSRGRQQDRSSENNESRARSKSQPRMKHNNGANNARSKSRTREERPRSRSRSRPRGNHSEGKKTEPSSAKDQTAPKTWFKTVEKKLSKSKQQEQQQQQQQQQERSSKSPNKKRMVDPNNNHIAQQTPSSIAATSSSRRSGSSPSKKKSIREQSVCGIEMVPFTSTQGSTGLLIIDGVEQCAMSSTPKAIRTRLEGGGGRRSNKSHERASPPNTDNSATVLLSSKNIGGAAATTKQKISSSSHKIINPKKNKSLLSRWGSGSPNKAMNAPSKSSRQNAALSKTPPPHSSSRRGVGVGVGAVARSSAPDAAVAVSPHEMDEMLDAITKFKLTARRLGVAKEDLLQAMSFATSTAPNSNENYNNGDGDAAAAE